MDEARNTASTMPPAGGDQPPWTCPFCSLLCDGFQVESLSPPRLAGSTCPRALQGLANFHGRAASAPSVNGQQTDLDTAVRSAAEVLRRSHLPLFGGLATDVAGARALYRLAARAGAVADPAAGPALFHGVRAMQDRGAFYTTLAEIRNRADLIVCLGTRPTERYPEFFRRCGVGEDLVAGRRVVFVGVEADALPQGNANVECEAIALQGDLFETVAVLNALLARRHVNTAQPQLVALAERMAGARYAVVVWESARLPEHGALLVEALQHLVGTLNQATRAAVFALGGSDGAYTVNQVFTWLSGLPLRTHVGPVGLEHDPQGFDATRLLADKAVDALLWVSCFGPEPAPPAVALPQVILGHPAMARPDGEVVFVPVSTPGIGSPGHLWRVDGGVVLPLAALYDDGLPSVAQVVDAIAAQLERSS